MKKILLSIIINFLIIVCFSQNPANNCNISYDYSSGAGWNTDKHLYTLSCGSLNFLTGTQGTHTFNGQLLLNAVQDASMNRVFRSFTPMLGNTFVADFEAKVSNPNNSLVGYALLALTQSDIPPLYDFSTSCATTQTSNSGIIVHVDNAIAAGPMNVSIISKFNSIATTAPTGFAMTSNVTYYFRIKRESASRLTFEVFSDAARVNLIIRKSCINIDDRITALGVMQHANNPAGGISRVTTGYIDNVCINTNTDNTCCTPKITGSNTICEGETPVTYTVNAVTGNTYMWMLPSETTYTANPTNTQITITNWGPITTIPKQVDITIKMYCHCDSFTVTYPVFVFPKRDADFSFQNLGNTGTILNNFQAISNNAGVVGTINQWSIAECDQNGVELTNKVLRNTFWENTTASGSSTFNIISNSTALNGQTLFPPNTIATVEQPWQDLVVGKYYVIHHGMYFPVGLCDWKGKKKVIYISNSNKVFSLGEPNTDEYKINLKLLKLDKKIK